MNEEEYKPQETLSEGERAQIMDDTWHGQESAIKAEIAEGIRAQLRAEYEREKAGMRGNTLGLTYLDDKYRKLGLWASYDNDPRLKAEAQRRMAEMRGDLVEKTLKKFDEATSAKKQAQLKAEHDQAIKALRTIPAERRSMAYAKIEAEYRAKGLKL